MSKMGTLALKVKLTKDSRFAIFYNVLISGIEKLPTSRLVILVAVNQYGTYKVIYRMNIKTLAS